MVIAFLSLTCGLILDTVTRGRWEAKRMAYLAVPGPVHLHELVAAAPEDWPSRMARRGQLSS
jgi:hypothetical protein